jgi:hypothetical protein
MRKALRPNVQKIQVARGVSIPAPVAGLDAISSQAAMPEDHAITLTNIFPQPGYIEIRGGAKHHRLTKAATKVETLMPYHGMSTNTLFAAAGTVVYEVTTANATVSASVAVSGLANARWQFVNFSGTGGHFLWMANGGDIPRLYDGATWVTVSVTGALTVSNIIQPAVFKRRIWVAVSGQISPWYLPTDSVHGALTQFPLTGVFEKGGELQAIGTWNFGGDGPDNFIAFISSRGECAVYSGDDPTDSTTFGLRGVYPLGEPVGRRCLTKVQGDLVFISIDGVVPLSRAVFTERGASTNIALTKNIQPLVNAAARAARNNFGWQLISYPRGTRAILNYPVTEGANQIEYVMNTVTGAWCKFEGHKANCWAVFNDRLFFGANDGWVNEADAQGFDDWAPIDFDIECAFNYCGARGQLKQWTQARPIIATDGQVAPSVGLSVDFDRSSELSTPTPIASTQALWDVAVWDVDSWGTERGMVTDWIGVSGLGYCGSLRVRGSVSVGTGSATRTLLLQLFGFDLQMMDGGLM